MERIHVHNGWHADAGRLENVNDLDARARLVRGGDVVSRDVVCNDDGDDDARRMEWLTVVAGTGYFFVWTVFGMAVFPLGVALATAEMKLPELSRAVPVAVGVVILIAGLLQFTGWKAQQLACCRQAAGCSGTMPASVGEAWRQGLRFGLHCSQCCFGLIITLLVVGVMDLRMMAVVAAGITAERFAPERVPVAQIIGVLVTGAGLFLIGRVVF